MKELDEISVVIKNLRSHIDGFINSINSAIERSGTTPELSTRKFFFRLGEGQMPSRLYRGVGSFNVLIIDETGVVMRQTLAGGGGFINHTHCDATEITLVTKGLIKEMVSGQVVAPGHCFRVEPGVPHHYEILENTIMLTTFVYSS